MQPNSILKYSFIIVSFIGILSACTDMSRLSMKERKQIASSLFQKGIRSKAGGDHPGALRYFSKAIEADSLFTDAYAESAEMLIADGADRQAEIMLINAPRKLKEESHIALLIGKSQFNQGKINESIMSLEKSLEFKSPDKSVFWMLAQLYYKVENYERASEFMKPLLADSLIPGREKMVSLNQKIDMILEGRDPATPFEKNMKLRIAQTSAVTRGELAFFLSVEFREWENLPNTEIGFIDVSPHDSLLDYYKKAVTAQVLELLPDNKFYSHYIIRRRNLAHYLYQILKHNGMDVVPPLNRLPVTDVAQDDLQVDAIRTVCSLNLMILRKDGQFAPDDPVTGKELIGSLRALKLLLQAR